MAASDVLTEGEVARWCRGGKHGFGVGVADEPHGLGTVCPGADLQGGLGGLQPPLQLLQPWISEVGDEEEEVEERRKWREGEEEEEISPPLIHFLDPPLVLCMIR